MQETAETRKKLADAIRTLQSQGNKTSIDRLVSAYKNKYKNPVNVGFDVPVTPEEKAQRLATAQTNAQKAQMEADAYKGNTGLPSLTPPTNNIGITMPQAGQGGNKVFSETLKGIGSTLASSEIGLGKTIAKTFGNQSGSYADTIGKLSQTQGQLLGMIKSYEKEGKDATNLKRAYNQTIAQLKQAQAGLAEESNLPTKGQVIGQVAGTVLDVATAGATKPAQAGLKQQASGLFTKQGLKNVAQGAGIGYGYDVSLGLQGARGEDRTNLKSLIPGLGTVIGGGIPAISESAKSVQNFRNPEVKTQKIVESNKKVLSGLKDNYAQLRKVTDKNVSRGYDVVDDIANTDLLTGSVDNTGTIRTDNAISELNQLIKPAEDAVKNNLLKEGKKVPLTYIEKQLRKSITDSGLEGEALTNALNKAKKEVEGLTLRADKDGFITLAKVHDAKVNKYATLDYLNPASKQADKTIARTFKEIVSTQSKSIQTDAVNKELGRFYAMQNFLEKLDGKKVKGGKLGKYFAQTVGGMVGSHFGPIGTIVGAELGGRVKGDMLSRTLSSKTGKQPIRSEVLEQAIETGKPNKAIMLPPPQSKSNSLGNLNTNQTNTIIPIKTGISKTLPQSKLNVNYVISEHLSESKDVLNTLPIDEFNKLGGMPALIERTKINIVDALNKYNQNSIASKIDKLDPTKFKSIFDFQDAVDSVISQRENLNNPLTNLASKIKNIPNKQGGFIKTAVPYKETGDLTTKILKDLEGKTTVSKQYILDATNRPELKQVERDLIRDLVQNEGNVVNVADFANKVKAELLPLKPKFGQGYEGTVLPDELRGDIKNYGTITWESPISTTAGAQHSGLGGSKKYYSHSRYEELPDNKTVRILEEQSDLYQKDNLDIEKARAGSITRDVEIPKFLPKELGDEFNNILKARAEAKSKSLPFPNGSTQRLGELHDIAVSNKGSANKGISKLEQYDNDKNPWWKRNIKENMKLWAGKGKTKLQFPTGETAMKIEGLGGQGDNLWHDVSDYVDGDEALIAMRGGELTPNDLKVGQTISKVDNELGSFDPDDRWIITDVLGDGKFKAVPKSTHDNFMELGGIKDPIAKRNYEANAETFDISGKVDTNNPIYKYYEKDVQKYLNKFGGKKVVDDKGVSWIEVPINKEMGKMPVEAFGKAQINPLLMVAGAGAGLAIASKANLPKKPIENKTKEVEDKTPKFLEAIAYNETNTVKNPYTYHKPSGNKNLGDDLGKYQITEGELKSYGKRYLGRVPTKKEFLSSPKLQDEYMTNKYKYLKKEGYSDAEIADIHRKGIKNVRPKGKDTYQSPEYVKSFLSKFNG